MADWIQAIGVIISLAIAGLRYVQVKKSEAVDSVKQMLNLTDEFDMLLEDIFRFKVLEANDNCEKGIDDRQMVVNYPNMQQEVLNYEAEFRSDLKDLWKKLSAAKVTWRFKAVSDKQLSQTLNNAAVAQRQLKTLTHYLEQDNMNEIQQWKKDAAKSLLVFSDDLTDLAVDKKIVKQGEVLKEFYPSLRYYVNTNQIIVDKIKEFIDVSKGGEVKLSNFYKDINKLKGEEKQQQIARNEWINKHVYITTVQKQLYEKVYESKDENKIRNDLIRTAVKGYALLNAKGSEEFKMTRVSPSLNSPFILTKFTNEKNKDVE